jgi:short-subunit dehydrogenase involved in D-alanine esterification of teichoic acids
MPRLVDRIRPYLFGAASGVGGSFWGERVVLVTGGNSGIGRAFAERLAADNARVIACGRNQGTLRELGRRSPAIEAVRCDIADRTDVLALVRSIAARHGRLDVLINNAAVMEQVDLVDDSVGDDRIEREIGINLTATILLTRQFLPLLRASGRGMVVMITSGYALLPATRAPTYSASKAGLHSFTLAMRRQLSEVGIRVVEVLPPLVDTPATRAVHRPKMPADALVERVLRDIQSGRDEILPGNVALLPMMLRLAPKYVARRVAAT